MKQRQRLRGAWSGGNEASYSVVEWEDSTGDAEVWEYDADDNLLRRFLWQRPSGAETETTLVQFAPDGAELSREKQAGPSRGW